MLLHGTPPNDFFFSIPIPKGPRVYVRKTQNYCATALSSIFTLLSQRNVINTSDLQFCYKSNCSTIMYSTIVSETSIIYPKVYVLFNDASNAFDSFCHIELFNILSDRNVYFLTCMVINNFRYDGITVYLLCTK